MNLDQLTANEIVLDDAQEQERQEWIAYVATLEPEDELFEAELEQWEANR